LTLCSPSWLLSPVTPDFSPLSSLHLFTLLTPLYYWLFSLYWLLSINSPSWPYVGKYLRWRLSINGEV
jgi:hypothetical protein